MEDMIRLTNTTMKTASRDAGYRSITESLAYDSPNFFADFESFQKYNWNFFQGFDLWIEDVKYKDYTMLKLYEKIGAESTALAIDTLVEASESVTDDQSAALNFIVSGWSLLTGMMN